MRAQLKVLYGSRKNELVDVCDRRFFVGRGSDCQLRPKSDAISRQHCMILMNEQDVTVHDLNSKNGTFVNGERVQGHCTLRDGDILRLGPLEFELLIRHDGPLVKVDLPKHLIGDSTAGHDADYDTSPTDLPPVPDEETRSRPLPLEKNRVHSTPHLAPPGTPANDDSTTH